MRWIRGLAWVAALLVPIAGLAQSSDPALVKKQQMLDAAAHVEALLRALKEAQVPSGVGRQGTLNVRALGTVTSPSNYQTFKLTVLTPAEALALVRGLRKDKSLPFEFVFDGANARAQTMVRSLEKAGVMAGKAWVEGSLGFTSEEFGEVRLRYHVAPLVLVGTEQAYTLQVLDPSFAVKPLSVPEWTALLTRLPGMKAVATYFTPRFHYVPNEKAEAKSTYDDEANEDAADTNDKHWEMLRFYRDQVKGR